MQHRTIEATTDRPRQVVVADEDGAAVALLINGADGSGLAALTAEEAREVARALRGAADEID